MEMGSNHDGGFGVLVSTDGLGIFGTLIILGICIAIAVCNAQQERAFCTDVCAQYHSSPAIQGSQCYCRDGRGVFDPAYGGR